MRHLKFNILLAACLSCMALSSRAQAPTIGIQNSPCVGADVVFYFTGSCTPTWSAPGGTITANNGMNIHVTFASAGSKTISASGSCGSASLPVTFIAAVTPTVSLSLGSTSFCQGSGSLTMTAAGVNGGTSPLYSYYIDGTQVSSGASTSYVYSTTGLAAGTHTARVTLMSSATCATGTATSSTLNFTVTAKATYTATFNGPSLICSTTPGASVAVTTGGAVGNLSYVWTGPGGTTTTSSTFTYPTVNNGDALSCKVYSDFWCVNSPVQTNVYTVSKTASVTPTVNISTTKYNYCTGETLTLTAATAYGTGGTTYTWKLNGAQFATGISTSLPVSTDVNAVNTFSPGDVVTVDATALTAVCATATTATGSTSAIPIVIYPLPNAAITSPATATTIWSTGSQPLTAFSTTGYTYQWKKDGAVISTGGTVNPYTATLTGNYTVVTTANGCSKESTSLAITRNTPPVANAGVDQSIVLPTTIALSGSGTDADIGGTISAYNWQFISGPSTPTFSNSAVAAPTVSGLTQGTYIFGLIVKDNILVNNVGEPSSQDQVVVTVSFPPNNYNWARETQVIVKNKLTSSDVTALQVQNGEAAINWKYVDGLGRPIQTVGQQASPGKNDLFAPVVYDAFGREATKYLPVVTGNNGYYKLPSTILDVNGNYTGVVQNFYNTASSMIAVDTKPFAKTLFEASPLNRVTEQGSSGNSWQPDITSTYSSPTATDHSVKFSYQSNGTNEVLLWRFTEATTTYPFGVVNPTLTATPTSPNYYASTLLTITKTKDEQNNEVIQYTDKDGHVILKRVQAVAGQPAINDVNYASTYYIYNRAGQLACVIPPEAVSRLATEYYQASANDATRDAFLSRWAYRYAYDAAHRMTLKQIPGTQVVYMVYDKRDRLVMTQDANQRSLKQWHFTKYDVLNRPALTGMLKTNVVVDQPTMQTRVNNYYAGLTGSQNFFETYQGSGVHGYTNNSYPQTDTLNNYLTVTYYDNYNFKSLFTNTTSFDYLNTELDGTGGYVAQESVANLNVTGQVTGGKVRMLATATWLKSVQYYDNKYRPIQTIADHQKGHAITTTVFDFVGKPLRTKTSLHTGQPISWTNMTGVQVQGDGLNCTGTVNWGQAATSVQILPAGIDGWTEATAPEVATNFYIGLADQYVSVATASIDYGMQIGGGRLTVYENGVQKFSFTNATAGDVMRVERVNGIVYYKKNGVIVYTSAAPSTTSLMTYVCMLNTGSKIYRPRVSNTFSAPTALVAESSFVKRFIYDHAGRLKETWHKLNNGTDILLSYNAYNELGQVIDKKLHSTVTGATDAKQSVDYRYNIRGWLTSINNAELSNTGTNDDTGDLFGMNLAYNDDLGTGNSANVQYNGNINAIKWSSGLGLGAVKAMAYNFTYDPINRLTAATHKQANTLNTWVTGQFDENGLTYDLNGNIKTLQRKGAGGVLIDDLTYYYAIGGTSYGNQLMYVNDNAPVATRPQGFIDGFTGSGDYGYDANGNMNIDKNKTLTLPITYNYLNLPEKVIRNTSNDYLMYYYDATGVKRTQMTNLGAQQMWTDYVGPWVFENNELQFIQHDEGRIVIAKEQRLYSNTCNIVSIDLIPTASVTLTAESINGEQYVKVTGAAGPSLSKLGVMLAGTYVVAEGERYLYRVKGYFNSVVADLYVKGNTADLIWSDTDVSHTSLNEAWVENTIVIPAGTTQISLGVLWNSTATTGDYFYINEIEFYKLSTNAAPEYQYHLKDHLGNVRVTFTTQNTPTTYTAGFETSNQGTEAANFSNYPTGAYVNTAAINAHAGTNSEYLSGGLHGQVGVAKSFSVMPGDQLQIQAYAKFSTPSSTGSNLTGFASALLGAFNLASPITGEAGTASAALNAWGTLEAGGNGDGSTAPVKVFVNIILFDKNYNFLDVSYQAVTTSGALISASYTVKEPGFAYMYISNEHPMLIDTYFDDVSMTITPSPLVATTDYYPFGLVSQTSSRLNTIKNNYLYNGKELQDEMNLGWLDYGARMYDPTIGRWGVIDQKVDLYKNITPYAYCANQPTNAIDPDGKLVIFINGFTKTILDQGTPWYWRQYEMQSVPNTNSWAALGGFPDNHYEPVQTGRAFDLEVSQQLGDENRMYVHGGNILGSGSRRSAGKDQGYRDAPDIIESLHRTGGVIDESIKFITHSMGGVYGDGYIAGLKKYLNEHPEFKSQVSITLIVDFDPFQAKQINNDGSIKKQQFTHSGKGSATGWLANQDEQGPHENKESSTEGSHSIFSFFSNIKNLQAGTYKWNDVTRQWDLQSEKKK